MLIAMMFESSRSISLMNLALVLLQLMTMSFLMKRTLGHRESLFSDGRPKMMFSPLVTAGRSVSFHLMLIVHAKGNFEFSWPGSSSSGFSKRHSLDNIMGASVPFKASRRSLMHSAKSSWLSLARVPKSKPAFTTRLSPKRSTLTEIPLSSLCDSRNFSILGDFVKKHPV